MYATIPVYYPSLEEADRNDERELWLESYNINMECIRTIEDRAMSAFNTRELDSLITDLAENYGVERAMYVLSRTVHFQEWDGRFNEVVRARAEMFRFPGAQCVKSNYITEIDPCIIDQIYMALIKIETENNMRNHNEYCKSPREPDDSFSEPEDSV